MLAGDPSVGLGGGGAEIRGWGGGAKDGLDLGNMENWVGIMVAGSFNSTGRGINP